MEPQVDEVNTLEIEIEMEDVEAQRQYVATVEGSIGREELKQNFQRSKSPKG